jgi:integrase
MLWISLDRCDWIWRAFYRLLILTGQRRDEVAGMAWSEIDLSNAVWVLPAARSKNGREHIIPLPASAVDILRSLPRIQIKVTINGTERHVDSPLVLTTTGKTSISGFSRDKVRLDKLMMAIEHEEAVKRGDDPIEIEPWRIHDLRRTVASGMARLGIGVAVAEKVMNHVSGTFAGIVGVYQRHDFLAEKRHALNLWADHVARLTTEREPNVVRLKMGED